MIECPSCAGDQAVKNGFTHNGKQNYKCTACGRQFVTDPHRLPITPQKIETIDRLLLERVSLAGICRVTGVSESRLQKYVNAFYESVPRAAAGVKKNGVAADPGMRRTLVVRGEKGERAVGVDRLRP